MIYNMKFFEETLYFKKHGNNANNIISDGSCWYKTHSTKTITTTILTYFNNNKNNK